MNVLRSRVRNLGGLTLAAFLSMATGCQSESTTKDGSSASGSTGGAKLAAKGGNAGPVDLAALEQRYIVGPAAARDLNYRVAWQFVGAGSGLKMLRTQGDSLFAVDEKNVLTRINADSGDRLWQAPIGDPVDLVFGVNLIDNKVYVTTDSSMVVLDGLNGTQISHQRFDKIANTGSVLYGKTLIYGSRNGQIIWHNYAFGVQSQAYQISRSINVQPVIAGGNIVAVGSDGTVMVITAAGASKLWDRKLLAASVSPPAASDSIAYFASTDQYLYAYDLINGRPVWKSLTGSPLTQGPTLIGDKVYQQIPGEGLACYDALSDGYLDGKLIWKSPSVKGNVLGERRGTAMAWDQTSKTFTQLETIHGEPLKTLNFPKVRLLEVAGDEVAEIYAAGDNGNIVKLVPRN